MEMLDRLDSNIYKGGWKDCSYIYLTDQARKCLNQLNYALQDHLSADVIREHAADAANFLMMIADVYGELRG